MLHKGNVDVFHFLNAKEPYTKEASRKAVQSWKVKDMFTETQIELLQDCCDTAFVRTIMLKTFGNFNSSL